MALKKIKTNREVLTKMLKELDEMDIAFLRERIINSTTSVINQRDELMVSMKNHFIAPKYYIATMEKILNCVKFDD